MIGTIVLYALTDEDARAINKRRQDYEDYLRRSLPGTGHVAHVGNRVEAGDVFPAVVVRDWNIEEEDGVNLSVLLDGTDTYWATSRVEGDGNLPPEPGTWARLAGQVV